MRFPLVIYRRKGAGTLPVLGTDGTLGTPPTASPKTPASADDLTGCTLFSAKASNQGWPGHRIAVSYKSSNVASTNVNAQVWFWDFATGAWYRIEASKALVKNTITFFDMPALLDGTDPAKPTSGAVVAYVMVEDTAGPQPDGTYEFGVGIDLTPLAV